MTFSHLFSWIDDGFRSILSVCEFFFTVFGLSEGSQKGLRRVSEGQNTSKKSIFSGLWDVSEHVFSTLLGDFEHIMSVSDRFLLEAK